MIFIHKTMAFAIRELNSQEEKKSCHNKTKFSLNYEIQSYLSACSLDCREDHMKKNSLCVALWQGQRSKKHK